MIAKHGIRPHGVIQVGSHWGEEHPVWVGLNMQHIVHFEPLESNCAKLKELHPDAVLYPIALGSKNHRAEMHTETVNGGQSCSLLGPKTHLDILPWIEFTGKEGVSVCRLDDVGLPDNYNIIYMDVQGYELEVLRGASKRLRAIDAIFTEVNRDEVFEGCAKIEEIDSFLAGHGFRRVETDWHGGQFGDALYVR